jgi:hypothetical protein
MPAGRHPKDWTHMAARHLLHQRHRATTILISRHSCAGSRTEICYNSDDEKGPGGQAGTFVFGWRKDRKVVTKQLILND